MVRKVGGLGGEGELGVVVGIVGKVLGAPAFKYWAGVLSSKGDRKTRGGRRVWSSVAGFGVECAT